MVKRILIIFSFWALSLFTLMIISTPDAKTEPIVKTIYVSKLQVVQAMERITYRDTIWLPTNMLCPQWAQLAVDVGWLEEDLPKLDAILHRESRCFTDSHYALDPFGGSYGLMQINAFWCKPSRYYPTGYLQSYGILTACSDLFHPRTNLTSARLIWQYSYDQYGDGWLPWQK